MMPLKAKGVEMHNGDLKMEANDGMKGIVDEVVNTQLIANRAYGIMEPLFFGPHWEQTEHTADAAQDPKQLPTLRHITIS